MTAEQQRAARILTGAEPAPPGCQRKDQYQGDYARYLAGWFKRPIQEK